MSVRRELADFQIVDEPWNKYKVDDGTVLKTRVIMTNARIAVSQVGQKNYSADFKYHIGCVVPAKNFVDPPNPRHSIEEIRSTDNLMEIHFDRISERVSQYELDDGTIVKAKLIFKNITKSRLSLDDGSPFYFLTVSNIWNQIEPPKTL